VKVITYLSYSNKYRFQSGFTLIETLIALSLLAIISLMSYQAIEVVIDADERSRAKQTGAAEIQRAWKIIQRDLMHIRNRPFRDGLGGVEPPYFTAKSDFGVRFSRGNGPMIATNPSGLRRVSYDLDDDQQLIRQSWGITESMRYSDGVSMVLLKDVDKILFEHSDGRSTFTPDWPPVKRRNANPLPRVIRVTITLNNGAETSRLFLGVSS
jgi:general secretion pathway protein J